MEFPSEKMHPNLQEDEQDMEMKPVVFAPPAYGSPDPTTQAGQLAPVEETHLELDKDYGQDVGVETVPVSSEASEDEDADDRPNKSASREEWDEYARSKGVNPDDFSTKDDLIDAL
jgi:hypothetical protein